jgi:hypothetical protein
VLFFAVVLKFEAGRGEPVAGASPRSGVDVVPMFVGVVFELATLRYHSDVENNPGIVRDDHLCLQYLAPWLPACLLRMLSESQ